MGMGRAERSAHAAARAGHASRADSHMQVGPAVGPAMDAGGTRHGCVGYVPEDRKENPGSFQNAGESLCSERVLRFRDAIRERMP